MKYSAYEIVQEYNTSARQKEEHEKVKWSCLAGMFNRFQLALERLPFADKKTWLDVGSGTGAAQALILNFFPHIKASALDISPELMRFAQNRKDLKNKEVSFHVGDFMEFSQGPFDIITCIGVLQKTCFSPAQFFSKASSLLASRGLVFLDTKNLDWEKFLSNDFFPEQDIEWFKVDELKKAAKNANLKVITLKGFLPNEGMIVPVEKSHNLFMIAQKTE